MQVPLLKKLSTPCALDCPKCGDTQRFMKGKVRGALHAAQCQKCRVIMYWSDETKVKRLIAEEMLVEETEQEPEPSSKVGSVLAFLLGIMAVIIIVLVLIYRR